MDIKRSGSACRVLRRKALNNFCQGSLRFAKRDLCAAHLLPHGSQFSAKSRQIVCESSVLVPVPNIGATASPNLDKSEGLKQADGRGSRVSRYAVFSLKLSDGLEFGAWWIGALLDLLLQILSDPAASVWSAVYEISVRHALSILASCPTTDGVDRPRKQPYCHRTAEMARTVNGQSSEGICVMYSHRRGRKFFLFLLVALALFFIVREPDQAAKVTASAAHGLMVVADALVAFIGSLN